MSKTGKMFENVKSDNINYHIQSHWLSKPTILFTEK